MANNLIVFDIGNTTVGAALFQGNEIIGEAKFPTNQAIHPAVARTEINKLLIAHDIQPHAIAGVAICSVVPSLTATILESSQIEFGIKAWVFDHTAKLGMKNHYDDPAQLGPDRLANALAAKNLYGVPVIAVDLGTATKFDVVNSAGEYLGGAIAPGISISAEALFHKAARLFEVEIEKPGKVIATNTIEAMKSGIFYGAIGQIDFILEKIIAEMGEKNVNIIATGGLAERFVPYSIFIRKYDPYLTYQGIRLGFELSQ
jgi:type III pantothenate kinase